MLFPSLSVISDFLTVFAFTFNSSCKILGPCLTYCLLADNLPYLAWVLLLFLFVFNYCILMFFLTKPLSFYYKSNIYSIGLNRFSFLPLPESFPLQAQPFIQAFQYGRDVTESRRM